MLIVCRKELNVPRSLNTYREIQLVDMTYMYLIRNVT